MLLARVWGTVALSCLLASGTLADDAVVPVESAVIEVSDELRALISQLDADDFADRKAASEELAKQGAAAVPALEEAVRGESVEARSRSFEILERLYKNGAGEAKNAARSALERLATGSDGAARRSQVILNPPDESLDQLTPPNGFRGGIRIRAGGIAPLPVIRAAVRTSVKMHMADGVRTLEVEQDGQKVKLTEDAAKGIEGEITQTKDGKETTEKFSAKNAEELKKNHPDAYKFYHRYVQAPRAGAPIAAGAIVERAPEMKKDVWEKAIERLEEQIEKLKNDEALPAEFRDKHVKSLERMRHRYQDQLKELDAAK